MAISKREHLIQTAVALFNQHGFHATGIATILAEAGISKKTLYHYFHSKDELILAVLQYQDSLFRNQFMRQVEAAAETPLERILAVFDCAEQWFLQQNFFGCIFINAVAEFSDKQSPVRDLSKSYKRQMQLFLLKLCESLPVAKPAELAESLAILLEGAIVTAQVMEKPHIAQAAKRSARQLIDAALATSATAS